MYALHAFLAENRDWPPRPTRERLPFPPSRLAPIVMAVIAIVFWITGPVALHSPWFAVGTAESRRILHGEVWRALTALTLHADAMHLLGNVLAGSIFLAVVFRRLGPGRGVFFTLLAGAFGNLANAALHGVLRTPHASIGASTAVFSALGILASTQLAVNRASGARRWTDRVGPIFGGLALLGMLGSSPHSDLWAHFFGLLAGGAMGWLAVRSAVTPERARRTQVHFGAAAAAMVIGAWLAAWMFARAHGVVAT